MSFTFAQTFSVIVVALATPLLSAQAIAQPLTPQMPTPPPMRFVARDDRSQLESTRDPKARVRLTIELADSRLTHMEQLTAHKLFEQASEALGNYLGLLGDVMRYIGDMPQDKNGTRDLYRRVDIALRAQIPRLAVMRRDTPAEFSLHIKAAETFARDTRSEALDSFYGHTVLREPPETKADANKTTPQDYRRP